MSLLLPPPLLAPPSFQCHGSRDSFWRVATATGRDDLGQPVVRLTSQGGEPLRNALRRAQPGEAILLGSYALYAEPGPFREFGPIYVKADAEPAAVSGPELFATDYFQGELVLRRYDRAFQIAAARRVEKSSAAALIDEWLALADTAWVDARFPEYGCFAARFVRTANR